MQITYLTSAFKKRQEKGEDCGDACVHGMGAYVMIDGLITSWYTTPSV